VSAPALAAIVRRGPVIEVRRVALAGGGAAYEKRYRVVWPWVPLAGLVKANMPPLDAREEARNAERLLALGIEAPRPLATGARWRFGPLSIVRETRVLFAEARGTPLDALLASRPPRALRRRIAAALGRLAGAMHRASIFHRDLYLCHLLWDEEAGRLSLIDVARAAPRRLLRERWRAKDLGALAFSARGLATHGDRAAFLRAYFGVRRLPREARAVAARALAKAGAIARKGKKG
jgi:heptose I phosphotransferase